MQTFKIVVKYVNFPFLDSEFPRRTSYGVYISHLLDSPELLQIVTLTGVIKPLLPNFLVRGIVILNIARRFRHFIADTVLGRKI